MTQPAPLRLCDLNSLDDAGFGAALGDLFEFSPWVAERATTSRPFASARALHDAMMACVLSAPLEDQLALIRAHPELAGREASKGTLTSDSSSEQSRLGINRLSHEAHARLSELNRRYRERFGFPCIIALRAHTSSDSVFAAFEQRLTHERDVEIALALDQIRTITRGRLATRLGLTDGRLTVHAIDTAEGGPARGLRVVLSLREDDAWQELLTTETNADGRMDGPLLCDIDMQKAVYQLEFHVGAYHSQRGSSAQPAFLDVVPIVFGIAEPGAQYHVPLLFSPWSYSTYRGSE